MNYKISFDSRPISDAGVNQEKIKIRGCDQVKQKEKGVTKI